VRFYSKLQLKGAGLASILKKDGIAVAKLEDFFDGALIYELKNYAAKMLKSPEVPKEAIQRMGELKGANKRFLEKLWGGYGYVLEKKDLEENPFIKFALSGKISGVAGEYFGVMPKLYHFDLQTTVVISEDAEAKLSQRWHRDPEDKKMCKVFVYFSDVLDEGSGPFKYVLGSQYGGQRQNLFPQRPPAGVYPPEGEVESAILGSDIKTCFGEAGTIVFADTAGLHKGGFSTTKPRLMLTISYVTDACPQPRYFTFSHNIEPSSFSPLIKAVLRR